MDFCIDALFKSQLPEQLFAFICNTTKMRHMNTKLESIEPHVISNFMHSLSYYKQYRWADTTLDIHINDVTNSTYFHKTSLYKLLINQDKPLISFVEDLIIKDYKKSVDGFVIKKMLSTGIKDIINFKHDIEPIIILKEQGKLTIVDGLHRIVSLFIENKADSVIIKAWVGSK